MTGLAQVLLGCETVGKATPSPSVQPRTRAWLPLLVLLVVAVPTPSPGLIVNDLVIRVIFDDSARPSRFAVPLPWSMPASAGGSGLASARIVVRPSPSCATAGRGDRSRRSSFSAMVGPSPPWDWSAASSSDCCCACGSHRRCHLHRQPGTAAGTTWCCGRSLASMTTS